MVWMRQAVGSASSNPFGTAAATWSATIPGRSPVAQDRADPRALTIAPIAPRQLRVGHEAARLHHDQPNQSTAHESLQRCRLHKRPASPRTLVIADEPSPFALRSTRKSSEDISAPWAQHRLGRGRVVGVTRVLESVGRYSGGITVGEAAIYFGQTSRSMVAVSSGGEDGMPARPSRLCHTPERKTGLDARNHGVSGAEPAIGRNCPSGLSWSVPPCLTATGPVRAGPGPGVGHRSVDPGSGAARPRRRGLVGGGCSPAWWPAVGADRGAAAPWS
jgi:hypothetical protein